MTTSHTRAVTDGSSAQQSVRRRPTDPAARLWLAQALRTPRYEVLALPGTADRVSEHVPCSVTVTITAAARRGLEPTLRLAEDLSSRGYHAVPHVAARLVRDRAHLGEVLQRLAAAGLTEMFVIAGDGDPVGDFRDSVSLLGSIAELQQGGTGAHLTRIGVAGYPQGHPFIARDELRRALQAKSRSATYVVSQMCFDHVSISAWLRELRGGGTTLPVHIGVAGPVDAARLLRIAGRIGVQDSAGFLLRHRGGGLGRLLLPRPYRPDRLVGQVAGDGADPSLAVAGLHVYTLGSVRDTERWRRGALERLATEVPP